jgi:hypothetical protein
MTKDLSTWGSMQFFTQQSSTWETFLLVCPIVLFKGLGERILLGLNVKIHTGMGARNLKIRS